VRSKLFDEVKAEREMNEIAFPFVMLSKPRVFEENALIPMSLIM